MGEDCLRFSELKSKHKCLLRVVSLNQAQFNINIAKSKNETFFTTESLFSC